MPPVALLAADLGTTRVTVGKWRRRFLQSGCDGLPDEARAPARRVRSRTRTWSARRVNACAVFGRRTQRSSSSRCMVVNSARGAAHSIPIAAMRFDFPDPFGPISTFRGPSSRPVWSEPKDVMRRMNTSDLSSSGPATDAAVIAAAIVPSGRPGPGEAGTAPPATASRSSAYSRSSRCRPGTGSTTARRPFPADPGSTGGTPRRSA